jgi:hypothetical protein
MTFRTCLLVLVALLAVNCGTSSPADQNVSPVSPSPMLTMASGTAAAGASAPSTPVKPFEARFTGSAHWEYPGVSPSNCTIVTTLTDAIGQTTHMGRVVASWSQCPAEPAYEFDGRLTITAANGDLLFGLYDFDPTSGINSFSVSWTGGTGRFAQASGSAVVAYTVIPHFIPGCNPEPDPFPCFDFSVPWQWSATATGTIAY